MLARALRAGLDQRLGQAAAARCGSHEEVVHDSGAARVERLPAPVDRREAARRAVAVAADQLHALALGVGDQRAADGEQRFVARRDLVEVAVAAQQRQQVGQVGLGDR